MDTYINIKIYCNNESLVQKSFTEIDRMYNDYDKLADRYDAYDDLINVNYLNTKLDLNKSIKIDKKLYDLLDYSKSYSIKTKGLFNIALGNVIDIWAQYRDGTKSGKPSISELQNSGSIDESSLVLMDDNTIMKTKDISLDLGGIAKGYVTELAGDYLESVGLDKYLITAGTSSVKVGNHYKNDRYKVGLINPNKTDDLYKIIKGNNISITTSGSYEKYYEYDGIRYSHLINPFTLYPPNFVLSVTVITDDASLGEVLSKALFLMPINDGLEYLKEFDGAEAIWYGLDGKIIMSGGMNKYE